MSDCCSVIYAYNKHHYEIEHNTYMAKDGPEKIKSSATHKKEFCEKLVPKLPYLKEFFFTSFWNSHISMQ